MKPDRSNYEIWFIDWLDNNLNETEVEYLMAFLKDNPDLQDEFNDLAMVKLDPSDVIFTRKKDLVKQAGSYTDSQFDNLCIAFLENDLIPGQRDELKEIIDYDEKKRLQFELCQKLKLKPPQETFKRKSIVKKLTTGQKILRLSFTGLSAAATIAILISLYLFFTSDRKKEPLQTAQNLNTDTLFIENRTSIFRQGTEIPQVQRSKGPERSNAITVTRASELVAVIADLVDKVPESTSDFQRSEALSALNVPIPENIISTYIPSANNLISYNPGYLPPQSDERNKAGQFLARFFHEKIMKDTSAVKRPVESYEIAVAGITGLNKLLGWEMSLQKNTDENGDVKSYYFSSRLLKFKSPVKKSANNL
jgi:hypothetical protein